MSAFDPDAMTFVQAMAAPPAGVEVNFGDGEWHSLCHYDISFVQRPLSDFRAAKYRRARQRRTRLREMADDYANQDRSSDAVHGAMDTAVRTVCRWLLERGSADWEPWAADRIRTEFLVPR